MSTGVHRVMKSTIQHLNAQIIILLLLAVLGCSSVKTHECPAAWNSLSGGMTKQEITGLIGPPTESSAQSGDLWRKAGWELQIDYDQYGRAKNIVRHPTGT
jgi:hypothetical protein